MKKHPNGTANTRCKNLISFDTRTDSEKSIILDQKARNWELYDGAEDRCTDVLKQAQTIGWSQRTTFR